MAAADPAAETDRRFMAAAIRFGRTRLGLTGTNPAVGALIVRFDAAGPVIVGRGATARGGRPHAETQALAEAGPLARGATAYVSLEPCAHYGETPPCADALVAAGVARVVGGAADPDPRVAGRGYARLRAAGVAVTERVLAGDAASAHAAFLTRVVKRRPHVTLKLALSADDMLGRAGEGQIAITGPAARRQVHLMRAEADAILVGARTALADDPELTVRLPGLEGRSPIRVVLDRALRLPLSARLARTARDVPLLIAAGAEADEAHRRVLAERGAEFLTASVAGGRIDLPDLLGRLAARGLSSVLVEGGAETARDVLARDLVDRLVLFRGPAAIGEGGVLSPIGWNHSPAGFRSVREDRFGGDRCRLWEREI